MLDIIRMVKFSKKECPNMSLLKLQNECIYYGIPSHGTKGEICSRLNKHLRKKTIKSIKILKECKSGKVRDPVTKRCKKRYLTQYDLLQNRKDFPELGIRRNDWLSNPCRLLKNLKKYLKGGWTSKNIWNMALTIPRVQQDRGYNTYVYGNNSIKIGGTIGQGSYGIVYDGSINNKKVAIKILQDNDPNEFLIETLIQNELFCGMDGNWGNGARVPKIEFICVFSSESNAEPKYMVGMEYLTGNGFSSSKNTDEYSKQIMEVSQLLQKLQDKFKFMHRDLHASNLMYKRIGDKNRLYIIDFGMATIKIGTRWINRSTGLYKKSKKFNPTHDLRMLMVTLSNRDRYYDNGNKVKLRILFILQSMLKYVDQSINEMRHPFHITYHMHNIIDNNFSPENIIKVMEQDREDIVILDNIKPKKSLYLKKNKKYVKEFKKYLSKK